VYTCCNVGVVLCQDVNSISSILSVLFLGWHYVA